jgi:hypothetical protein
MKNIIGIIAAVCLAATLFGCASKPPASEAIENALLNVPLGVLVAITTAWDAATADSEAEVQLIQAMTSMLQNMIDQAVAADEITTDTAQALFSGATRILIISVLDGAVRHNRGVGQGDVYWTVMYMEKTQVVDEISRAVAAAILATTGAESFSIDSRIDEEFQKAIAIKWTN